MVLALETKHMQLKPKTDETGSICLDKDELQEIFYCLIGRASRTVSEKDINSAFTEALAQWT